ncbi:MAG: ATP-binding protein [Pseudodesulfovibrio sp.]
MRILVLLGKGMDERRVIGLLTGHECEAARYGTVSRGVRRLERAGADAVVLAPDPGDETWARAVARIRREYGTPSVVLLPGGGPELHAASDAFDVFALDRTAPEDMARCLRHLARQRDLEERLKRHTALFDWVEETAWMGTWRSDGRGRTEWSRGARRILEAGGDRLTGDFGSVRGLVHPDDLEIFEQANRATFSQGWPLDFEYRVVLADGRVRHLHLHRRVEHGRGGEVVRAFGMIRDVTPEREFEDVLFRRDAVLQVVGSCAAGFLREADWEHGVDDWLAELGRAMDVTRAYIFRPRADIEDGLPQGVICEWAAPGTPLLKGQPEAKTRPVSILYKRLLPLMLDRKVVACHTRDLHAEERAFLSRTGVKSLMLIPIFAGGEWWGLIGLSEHRAERDWLPAEIESLTMMADILGSAVLRARMERELRTANRMAQDATRAKSLFLANMSHEIRTPVGGILGMAEMMAALELPADLREHVDMIRDAARSLLTIVNDVLDLSRVEARRLQLVPADFDLRTMLDRTLAPFAAEARQKGIEFALAVDPGVDGSVRGDASRLAQVLRNLVGNALKFTAKGFVRVAVGQRDFAPGRRCLGFTVADSGEGIPPEMQDSIFDTFVQGDSSARKRHQGTGLGLAICRELVAMMGGEIRVESEPGRGSVFAFTVCFADAGRAADPAPDAGGAGPSRRLHLLLAEDNPLNQRFLTHFLTWAGHRVTVAGSGVEALEALSRHGRDLDLVLMDIQMPAMDGFETTAAIRAGDGEAFDPAIPIIALTAYAMKGDRERMVEAGMNGYVPKPVEMDVLTRAMARCLDGLDREPADGPEPQPTAPAGEVDFDMDALASRYRGNVGLLREVLALFRSEAAEKLALFDRGRAADDPAMLREAVHGMANLASHVLALSVVRRARELETQCCKGREGGFGEELARLRADFVRLADRVERRAESL